MSRAGLCVVLFATGAVPGLSQSVAPLPTQVLRYSPPTSLPDRAQNGTCQAPAHTATSRDDAFRCVVDTVTLDPCFRTTRPGHVLCDVDPRRPASGTLVAFASPGSTASGGPISSPHAWFFELADGSACQPIAGAGREVEDLAEVYSCRFVLIGDADAVLGDLDTSTPVWTIRKVVINKKAQPPTIKSVTMAVVTRVWQ